jgi:hypothetical protein
MFVKVAIFVPAYNYPKNKDRVRRKPWKIPPPVPGFFPPAEAHPPARGRLQWSVSGRQSVKAIRERRQALGRSLRSGLSYASGGQFDLVDMDDRALSPKSRYFWVDPLRSVWFSDSSADTERSGPHLALPQHNKHHGARHDRDQHTV